MYPAKVCAWACVWGVSVSVFVSVSVSVAVSGVVVGMSLTGTPVRLCRSGGIVGRECAVGVRIRRRRGLAMAEADEDVIVFWGFYPFLSFLFSEMEGVG